MHQKRSKEGKREKEREERKRMREGVRERYGRREGCREGKKQTEKNYSGKIRGPAAKKLNFRNKFLANFRTISGHL